MIYSETLMILGLMALSACVGGWITSKIYLSWLRSMKGLYEGQIGGYKAQIEGLHKALKKVPGFNKQYSNMFLSPPPSIPSVSATYLKAVEKAYMSGLSGEKPKEPFLKRALPVTMNDQVETDTLVSYFLAVGELIRLQPFDVAFDSKVFVPNRHGVIVELVTHGFRDGCLLASNDYECSHGILLKSEDMAWEMAFNQRGFYLERSSDALRRLCGEVDEILEQQIHE